MTCRLVFFIFGLATMAQAVCPIQSSQGTLAPKQADALYVLLNATPQCPQNVLELKDIFANAGLKTAPSMVANRGFHNSTLGSFSFFEQVTGKVGSGQDLLPGDLFFGHFTDAENGKLILDQSPSNRKLLIELLVWDPAKGYFNFYELRGMPQGVAWFYRGDSLDIVRDNTYLYRKNPAGTAKFGNTLRCAACHSSGGPIQKELAVPQNDWWSQSRPLPFDGNSPSMPVAQLVTNLVGAAEFSSSVKTGIKKLQTSTSFQLAKKKISSLQEKLRPLFCEVEVNLVSDSVPSDENSEVVNIPSPFFVNPFLAEGSLKIGRSDYERLLSKFKMQFPETLNADSDHAWLTPVKSFADQLVVESLEREGSVSAEFVAAVLSIDFKTPLFSSKRCGLLRSVPEKFSRNWPSEFKKNLAKLATPEATELLGSLADPKLAVSTIQEKVKAYLTDAGLLLGTTDGQEFFFKKLLRDRAAVFSGEISQNPLGQIFEPGFRVIFPVPGNIP